MFDLIVCCLEVTVIIYIVYKNNDEMFNSLLNLIRKQINYDINK